MNPWLTSVKYVVSERNPTIEIEGRNLTFRVSLMLILAPLRMSPLSEYIHTRHFPWFLVLGSRMTVDFACSRRQMGVPSTP